MDKATAKAVPRNVTPEVAKTIAMSTK